MDRKEYRGPKIKPNKKMSEAEEAELKHPPFVLNNVGFWKELSATCASIAVINCWPSMPEPIMCTLSLQVAAGEAVMNAFKAYATRRLRGAGLLANGVKPWSRHGSNPYLWTSEQVARAMDYVLNGQDDKPFDRDPPQQPIR